MRLRNANEKPETSDPPAIARHERAGTRPCKTEQHKAVICCDL